MFKVAVPTVVVGSETNDDSKDAPHVIARVAVPVIVICSKSPCFGVPERFVVMLVISAARAVM